MAVAPTSGAPAPTPGAPAPASSVEGQPGREVAARETGAGRGPADGREAADARPGAPSGCLSVNAIPFAAVYVDGRHVGDTPRACVRVRAGSHQVHFESPAGRSPERAVVVTAQHTADSPLAVSYDFTSRRFLGP
jgi:hypothetical protein